jgi:hypothetical protein
MTDLTVILLAGMLRLVAGYAAGILDEIGERNLSGKGIFLFMAHKTIGDCFVFTYKGIPCLLMVEIFDIPIHQLCFISLMFCVTEHTVFSFIPMIASVP